MKQSVFIPKRFPGLNDYINAERRHRMIAANMKKEYTDLAASFCLLLKPLNEPVSIKFTWYEKNARRDPDNIIFAKKFILDGMVKAGVIPDDTQKWIKIFVEFWEVGEEEGVKVEIETL